MILNAAFLNTLAWQAVVAYEWERTEANIYF
jgi:hypothetical protein